MRKFSSCLGLCGRVSLKWLSGTLALVLAVQAAPAFAKLEDTILTFKHSGLLKDDTLFKFDGRVGARYRFSGATHCKFGNGLLYVDTQDGVIVQETIVLPLPTTPRERQLVESIMALFVKDLALDKKDSTTIVSAFEEGIQAGKSQELMLGNPLWRKYELHVYANPTLRGVLVMVGLAP